MSIAHAQSASACPSDKISTSSPIAPAITLPSSTRTSSRRGRMVIIRRTEAAAVTASPAGFTRAAPSRTSGISSAASIASSHAPAVRWRIPSRSHAPESTPENVSTSRMVASSIPTVMFFASLFGFIMRAFGGFMRGGKR